jgi:hypothetical protein
MIWNDYRCGVQMLCAGMLSHGLAALAHWLLCAKTWVMTQIQNTRGYVLKFEFVNCTECVQLTGNLSGAFDSQHSPTLLPIPVHRNHVHISLRLAARSIFCFDRNR